MSTKSFRELFDEARQTDAYWEERAVLDFTEEIYGRMEALGLRKSQLAERLGTSPAYVTKILGGDANFTLKTMVRLARALDASVHVHVAPDACRVRWFDLWEAPRTRADHLQPRDEDFTAVAAAEGGAEDGPAVAA